MAAFIALIGGNLGLILANRALSATIVTLRMKNVPLYWIASAALVAFALTIYWPAAPAAVQVRSRAGGSPR